jgi:hypothetical protein
MTSGQWLQHYIRAELFIRQDEAVHVVSNAAT